MIEIKNIHISYHDQTIIKQGDIIINNGILTGLNGPSGSGKTTLFYIIGLISQIRGYDYYYNGQELDINDDHLKSSIRKNKIGFIFQDKNLHEYLSIEDNLRLYSYISGNEFSSAQAQDILKKVHIDLDMSTITRTLSGGEKQRLAIACALIKNPELIIADEPTSALDDENAKYVIDILKDIANDGKMVIIATHNKDILNQCQVQYEIKNKEIITHQDISLSYPKEDMNRVSLSKSFYYWYSRFSFGRKKHEKFLMIFIPALIVSICMIAFSVKDELIHYYEDQLNKTSSKEVLVVNNEKPITNQSLQLLKKIEGISDIHYVYSEELFELKCNEKRISLNNPITIVAYYDYQKDSLLLDQQYQEGDIYLSNHLAKKLQLNNQNIIELNSLLLKQKTFQIAGVLKENQTLTQSQDIDAIYIPLQYINQTESYKVLVNLESFQYLDGISDKISSVNYNYQIILSQSKYLSQILFINMYEDNLSTFLIVLLSSVIILLSIMNFFAINNQKYEITVLKANGLSKSEITYLMFYMMMKSILITMGIVVGVMLLENGILLLCGIESFVFSIKTISFLIGFVLLTYVIPQLLSIMYLNHFDAEKILRF